MFFSGGISTLELCSPPHRTPGSKSFNSVSFDHCLTSLIWEFCLSFLHEASGVLSNDSLKPYDGEVTGGQFAGVSLGYFQLFFFRFFL